MKLTRRYNSGRVQTRLGCHGRRKSVCVQVRLPRRHIHVPGGLDSITKRNTGLVDAAAVAAGGGV